MTLQSRKTRIYSVLILVIIIVTITISTIVIYRILKSNSESNLAFKRSLYLLDQQLAQKNLYFLKKTDKDLLDYKINYYQSNPILENNNLPSDNHLKERGINDTPVYINDCGPDQNTNERYLCLFFY